MDTDSMVNRAREGAHHAVLSAERAAEEAAARLKAPVVNVFARTVPPPIPGVPPPPLKDLASRKVHEATQQLHDALPIFSEAGYTLQSLDIEIGVPPKLAPHFLVTEYVDEATRQAILDRVKSQRLVHMTLAALYKASDLQRHIQVGDLAFRGIVIHITTIPKVTIRFLSPSAPERV